MIRRRLPLPAQAARDGPLESNQAQLVGNRLHYRVDPFFFYGFEDDDRMERKDQRPNVVECARCRVVRHLIHIERNPAAA